MNLNNAVPTVAHNFLPMEHQIILPEIGEHHKVSPFVTVVIAVVIQPIIAIHGTLGYPSSLEPSPRDITTTIPDITPIRETKAGLYVSMGTRRGREVLFKFYVITEFYVMNEHIPDRFEHNGATVHKNTEESQIVQQTIDKGNEPSLKTCFSECATHFDNLEATTPRKPNRNPLDVDTNNSQVPFSEPITSIGIDEIQLNDKPGNLTLQGTIGGEQPLFLVDTGAAITAISGA